MKSCAKCSNTQLCNPLTGRCRKCQTFEKLILTQFSQSLNLDSNGSKAELCKNLIPQRDQLEAPLGFPIQKSVAKQKKLQKELKALTSLLTAENSCTPIIEWAKINIDKYINIYHIYF